MKDTKELLETLRGFHHSDSWSFGDSLGAVLQSSSESEIALDYMIEGVARDVGVDPESLRRVLLKVFIDGKWRPEKLISMMEDPRHRHKMLRLIMHEPPRGAWEDIERGGACSGVTLTVLQVLKLRIAWEKTITEKALNALRRKGDFDLSVLDRLLWIVKYLER